MKDYPLHWVQRELTCRNVTDRASEHLAGCLPITTNIRVGLHLASCAGCRTYVAQIGLVSSALRNLPKLYPSPVNRLCLRRQFAALRGSPA